MKAEAHRSSCACRSIRKMDRMSDTIRCVIVDDEPPARRLLKRILEQGEDVVVVAEADNGREAVDAIRMASPDVVFLDVAMPELNGFEVLASLSVEETP